TAVRAGAEESDVAERIACGQLVGACVGACLGASLVAGEVPLAVAALVPVTGLLVPALSLRDRAKRRELAIGRALPWTLDLFGLAVEVGADFNVALVRVVEQGRRGP